MPSIRNHKLKKRSRQQRHRRPIWNINNITRSYDEKMRLKKEQQEAYDMEEGPGIKLDSSNYPNKIDEEDYNAFDNGGGALKKRSKQQGGCGFKKNIKRSMRPSPRSDAEKAEMRENINQLLASGELKLGPIGPAGNQTVVDGQTGGRKARQSQAVSLRTAVKLLKKYYTKRG